MEKINILIIFLLFFGCNKENTSCDNDKIYHLNGYWLNISENKDTLLITDSIIYRSHFQTVDTGLYHKYDYNIKQDTLEMIYKGIDKVAFTKPFIHKLKIDKEMNILTIEDFEKTYPGYIGNKFKLLNNE